MLQQNQIYLGDANILMQDIPDNSVDIVLTDPAYVKEQWFQCYSALAKHAPRILKPSGWLISYSGHFNLDKVMRMFGDAELEYYWMDCQLNEGPTALVHARNVICGWKPIVIYQKSPLKKNKRGFFDVIRSQCQKKEHPWQQSLEDILFILRRFSEPGQTLVDPFCGSGTTITGAKMCGLNWYAFEIDPATWRIAMNRQKRESLFEVY